MSRPKAAYRFWDNPRVDPDVIRATLRRSALEQVSAQEDEPLLAIQDSTSFDFTDHPETTGLGYLSHRKRSGLGGRYGQALQSGELGSFRENQLAQTARHLRWISCSVPVKVPGLESWEPMSSRTGRVAAHQNSRMPEAKRWSSQTAVLMRRWLLTVAVVALFFCASVSTGISSPVQIDGLTFNFTRHAVLSWNSRERRRETQERKLSGTTAALIKRETPDEKPGFQALSTAEQESAFSLSFSFIACSAASHLQSGYVEENRRRSRKRLPEMFRVSGPAQ